MGHFYTDKFIPDLPPNHDEVYKTGFALLWHTLDKSSNPVERAFDELDKEYKQIVLAIADVDCEGLTEPTSNQSFKLRHYNELGRRKIAKAIFKISMIKKAFPAQMLIKDFINIDKHTGQNKFIPDRLPNHDEVYKAGFALLWRTLDKSGNPVERAFDGLEREYKDIVLAIADVESSDLVNPVSNQYSKLKHYTEMGRRKIGKAIFVISVIRKAFPEQMTIKDFINIDEEIT